MVKQAEALLHAKASFVQINTAFNNAYEKVVNYWRREHPGMAEKYHSLVRQLKNFPKTDWEEVCGRVAHAMHVCNGSPPGVQMLNTYRGSPSRNVRNLMDALCELSGRTPDVENGLMLLQNHHDNAAMGDKDARWQRYDVLFLYFLERLDPFSFCGNDRIERIVRYITHKDFHPDHLDFFIIADVAQGLVRWLKQLHPFVLAARPINDERRKVLALRVRVKQKQGLLWQEQDAVAAIKRDMHLTVQKYEDARQRKSALEEQIKELEAVVRRVKILRVTNTFIVDDEI